MLSIRYERAGTVEERILELQEWKRGMVDIIMGEHLLVPSAFLKKQDIQFLLGHVPCP
jgi:SNF2 family DNA or RNA helicase